MSDQERVNPYPWRQPCFVPSGFWREASMACLWRNLPC